MAHTVSREKAGQLIEALNGSRERTGISASFCVSADGFRIELDGHAWGGVSVPQAAETHFHRAGKEILLAQLGENYRNAHSVFDLLVV